MNSIYETFVSEWWGNVNLSHIVLPVNRQFEILQKLDRDEITAVTS